MATTNAIESSPEAVPVSVQLKARGIVEAVRAAELAVEGAAGLLRGWFDLRPGAGAWSVHSDATMDSDALAGVESLLQTASDRLGEAQDIYEPDDLTGEFEHLRDAIVLSGGLAQLLRSAAKADDAEALQGWGGAVVRDQCERILATIQVGIKLLMQKDAMPVRPAQ